MKVSHCFICWCCCRASPLDVLRLPGLSLSPSPSPHITSRMHHHSPSPHIPIHSPPSSHISTPHISPSLHIPTATPHLSPSPHITSPSGRCSTAPVRRKSFLQSVLCYSTTVICTQIRTCMMTLFEAPEPICTCIGMKLHMWSRTKASIQ